MRTWIIPVAITIAQAHRDDYMKQLP